MSILKRIWNNVSNLREENSRNIKPRKKKLLASTENTSVLPIVSDFFANISDKKKNNVITIIKQFQSVKFVGIALILDLFSSDFRLTEHSGELH